MPERQGFGPNNAPWTPGRLMALLVVSVAAGVVALIGAVWWSAGWRSAGLLVFLGSVLILFGVVEYGLFARRHGVAWFRRSNDELLGSRR